MATSTDSQVEVTLAFDPPASAEQMRDRFLELARRMNELDKERREHR